MNGSVTQSYAVYKLIDPRDKLPHYVGYTVDPMRRYQEHLDEQGMHSEKVAWISDMAEQGLKPAMEIIEIIRGSAQDAMRQEAYWILSLRREGMPLINKTYQERSLQEKQKAMHPADLLIQSLIGTPYVDFRKIAERQKRKINQGITMPEALFTIYKTCAMQYGLRGQKIPMGDLIAKALIKYLVEEILPELAREMEV